VTTTLDIPGPLWQAIREDLLSTPHLERAAVGFAGLTHRDGARRLLLRDWAPVSSNEYLVQLGYHLEVDPAFWARHAKRARHTGEALVIVHSHPSDTQPPTFSHSDDEGEARLIPKIQARASVPVAAVVLSPAGESARVTKPGSRAQALDVRSTGLLQHRRAAHADAARFDRQLRVLGREGHEFLLGLRIGVVGVGGLGSHVIQQLIHLGVGRILAVDPDRVSTTNMSRLVGASHLDARLRRPKTRVAHRLARHVGGPSRVIEVNSSVTDETTARRLLDCDVIVGCTDDQWSRMVLNALGYQFYVPVLDLGVELQTSGAMGGRVTWLAPGSPCLWCLNVLDAQRVRVEQLPPATLRAELTRGYVQGLEEPAPAVVSINGVVASLAVTELLARTTGFAGLSPRADALMYRIVDGVVRRTSPPPSPDCPTCSAQGQFGLGDLGTAPWTNSGR